MNQNNTTKKPLLSLTLVVKNEEKYVDGCLQSVHGIADEIIIVDTGSTDRTIEIAQSHGVQINHFPWIDDFSAARNNALQYATGEWVLVLDADERLKVKDKAEFLNFLDQPNIEGGFISIHNKQNDGELVEYLVHKAVRLFRRRPEYRFTGSIHEDILPSILQNNGCVKEVPAWIEHFGYSKDNIEKKNRNLSLLFKKVEEEGENFVNVFYIAKQLASAKRFSESILYFKKTLELFRPGYHEESIAFQACLNAAQASLSVGDLGAMDYFLLQSNNYKNTDLNNSWLLEIVRAEYNERRGDAKSALAALDNAISIIDSTPSIGSVRYDKLFVRKGNLFFQLQSFDDALSSYEKAQKANTQWDVPAILAGACYLLLGNIRSAETCYDTALVCNPASTAGRKGFMLCQELSKGKVNA